MYVWVPLALAFLGLCVACLRPRTRSSIVGALLTLSYLALAPVSVRVFQYFGCTAVILAGGGVLLRRPDDDT